MNKMIQIQDVIQYLHNWQSKIRLNNCLFFYDINKASEGVTRKVISLVYKLEKLEDLNNDQANYPGIDLGDKENGICFQVSSSFTTSKIRDTLKTYFDIGKDDNSKRQLSSKFPILKFFFITDNEENFSTLEKKNILEIDNNFNFSEQILTLKNIIKEINKIYDEDKQRFDLLLDFLKTEFGPLKNESKIQNYFLFNIHNKEAEPYFELDHYISKYLDSHKNKYIFTKTFIHRQEISFYDFYTPLSIDSSDNKKFLIDSVSNFFKSTDKNYVSIIGKAGSGKSTLVKFLFLNCIETFYCIPILIELRKLNDYQKDFLNYLVEVIFYNKVSIDTANKLFSSGKLLFIFDGFDEINFESRQRILQEIERFTDCYNNNKYIITSRPGVNIESFQRFKNYRVSPLTIDELEKFIAKQIIIYPEEDDAIKSEKEELRNRIINKIKSEYSTIFNEYLTNPLLLSMFILTFEQYPDIPNSKSKFYSNVFETLYQKHDAFTKNSWVRPKLSGLEQIDYENILEKFSFKAYKESKASFSKKYFYNIIDDLKKANIIKSVDNLNLLNDFTVSIPVINEDGFEEYCFVHKSLMDYFAANAIHNSQYSTKIKLYEGFVKDRVKRSTYDNNFHTICFELDTILFKELVLLPLLSQVKDELLKGGNENDEKTIFRNYLQLANIGIILKDNNSFWGIRSRHTVVDSLYEIIDRANPASRFYSYFFPFLSDTSSLVEKYKNKLIISKNKRKESMEEKILYLYDIELEDLIKLRNNKEQPNSNPVELVNKLFKEIILLIEEYQIQINENRKNEINFFEL